MDKALYEKVKAYRTSLAVIKELLKNGLISDEEYTITCTVLAKKSGLSMSTIFSEIDLISAENDGNIRH